MLCINNRLYYGAEMQGVKMMRLVFFHILRFIIVYYDTCALSSPLLHGMKLGPSLRSGPNFTPCNGLLKTLVSYKGIV